MNPKQASGTQRRSRREVEDLVAKYAGSGLKPSEFCRKHGLALSTLGRHRKQLEHRHQGGGGNALLAVEVCGAPAASGNWKGNSMAVVLGNGRRIEVERGFDAGTLQQLVGVLERI